MVVYICRLRRQFGLLPVKLWPLSPEYSFSRRPVTIYGVEMDRSERFEWKLTMRS